MNTKDRPSRIHLIGESRYEEGYADAVIKPGHLIALTADPTGRRYVPHSVAGGRAETLFALEDALQGRSIEDDYASGELVCIAATQRNDVVFAWLAAGESVTPADKLVSNGDGTLRAHAGTEAALAVPLEVMDASESSASGDVRIRVRIL